MQAQKSQGSIERFGRGLISALVGVVENTPKEIEVLKHSQFSPKNPSPFKDSQAMLKYKIRTSLLEKNNTNIFQVPAQSEAGFSGHNLLHFIKRTEDLSCKLHFPCIYFLFYSHYKHICVICNLCRLP